MCVFVPPRPCLLEVISFYAGMQNVNSLFCSVKQTFLLVQAVLTLCLLCNQTEIPLQTCWTCCWTAACQEGGAAAPSQDTRSV